MPESRKPGPTTEPGPHIASPNETHSSSAFTDPVTVAHRYMDAAKEQARGGIITWKQYRDYCLEVRRITRLRTRAAEDAARIPSGAEVREWGRQKATEALMRRGGKSTKDVAHLDPQVRKNRRTRRANVAAALRDDPSLSDREHARRIGVDHKTVGSVRRALQESGEIPTFIRRIDPRTGRMSQPAVRRTSSSSTAMAVGQ